MHKKIFFEFFKKKKLNFMLFNQNFHTSNVKNLRLNILISSGDIKQ
jgi:hypothetical protein